MLVCMSSHGRGGLASGQPASSSTMRSTPRSATRRTFPWTASLPPGPRPTSCSAQPRRRPGRGRKSGSRRLPWPAPRVRQPAGGAPRRLPGGGRPVLTPGYWGIGSDERRCPPRTFGPVTRLVAAPILQTCPML
jgi:hypothetical protein